MKARRIKARSMNNCWGRHLEKCYFNWATSKGTTSDCFNWGNQKDLKAKIYCKNGISRKQRGLIEDNITHSLNSFWHNQWIKN